jgi:hypothetical protein
VHDRKGEALKKFIPRAYRERYVRPRGPKSGKVEEHKQKDVWYFLIFLLIIFK